MVDDPRDPRNRAAKITERYNEAQRHREEVRAAPPERRESGMVRGDAPRLELTPTGSLRDEVDRKVYNERLQAERAEELKRQAQARKAKEPDRSRSDDERSR